MSDGLGRLLQAIGALVLAAMMFLGAADVILRYFFNSPISGAYELVEYMMAIIVPFGLCVCAPSRLAHLRGYPDQQIAQTAQGGAGVAG